MSKATLVVPCYNEAQRLDRHSWRSIALHPSIRVIFVDDGSTDDTASLLNSLIAELPAGSALVLRSETNRGKGEAVRAGMLQAFREQAKWIGYVDSDLATPSEEIQRFVETKLDDKRSVVLASRVRLLGHAIRRRPVRHFLGRVFASLASLSLELPVYDTQCGCKFFYRNSSLASALAEPFTSRWIFDVELLGRLLYPVSGDGLPVETFLEVPLLEWADKAGSKVRPTDFLQAGADLCRLWWALRPRKANHERLVPVVRRTMSNELTPHHRLYKLSHKAQAPIYDVPHATKHRKKMVRKQKERHHPAG